MNEHPNPNPVPKTPSSLYSPPTMLGDWTAPFSREAASRLLSIGLAAERRPVEALIDALEDGEPDVVLRRLLAQVKVQGPSGPIDIARVVLGDAPSVADLKLIKEAGKKSASEPGASGTSPVRLAGLAAYFLALAAALARHGKLISGQTRDQVDEALLELGSALADPWRGLILAAVRAGK
jgi:hypothetical protein